VFQFESSGMREALRQVKPTEFEDLIALVALYRPGPMQFIPDYARAKADPSRAVYEDERLRPVTETTHSICIYQEQYMEIAKQLAGFTPAEADDLRKAIGKKIASLMASLKDKFIQGCVSNEISEQVARSLWAKMEVAADYSFNKSHAACYALIAYQTAYLRANYAPEYMAALISSVMSTKDRVPFYVSECADMGLEVLPPDVNSSQSDFAVVEGRIRFGLTAVKRVGEGAVRAIIAAREQAPFASIWDFCERVDAGVLNKGMLESLICCGALDSTGATRKGMLQGMEQALSAGQKSQADAMMGHMSIFDLTGEGGDSAPALGRSHPALPADEFPRDELLRREKEALGLYVSSHPLSQLKEQLLRRADCPLKELGSLRDGQVVTVGGLVTALKPFMTKKGDRMVFAELDDSTGSVEVVVFANTLATCAATLVADAVVLVKGRVDHKAEGEVKLVAFEVTPFEAAVDFGVVKLRIDARRAPAAVIAELKSLIGEYPGDAPVVLELDTSDGQKMLRFGPSFRVRPDGDFFAEAKALLGDAALIA
ncbi:MAG: DNA polymerase III subunit alpha, partial [Gaiellales bacterium]